MIAGLSSLPDDRLLMMLTRYLKAQMTHPVGSELWGEAMRAHADCQREWDKRMLLRIIKATTEPIS